MSRREAAHELEVVLVVFKAHADLVQSIGSLAISHDPSVQPHLPGPMPDLKLNRLSQRQRARRKEAGAAAADVNHLHGSGAGAPLKPGGSILSDARLATKVRTGHRPGVGMRGCRPISAHEARFYPLLPFSVIAPRAQTALRPHAGHRPAHGQRLPLPAAVALSGQCLPSDAAFHPFAQPDHR